MPSAARSLVTGEVRNRERLRDGWGHFYGVEPYPEKDLGEEGDPERDSGHDAMGRNGGKRGACPTI